MIYRRALLWCVPLLISLHNIEEQAGMPRLLAELPARLPGWIAGRLPAGIFPPTYRQFLVLLLFVTVLPYLFAMLKGARKPRSLRTSLLVGTQAVMLINVFSHLGSALLVGGYVPGLVTALGINLPFSLYLFWQGLKSGWIRNGDLGPLFVIALLLHGPGLIALMFLAAPVTALIH